MGAPILIDSIGLLLGRFLRIQKHVRGVPVGRHEVKTCDQKASLSTHITLSSGQMLLPDIGTPYQFLK